MNRGLVAGVILTAALVSGGMLIQSGSWQEAAAAPGTPRLLQQVFSHIQRDYIDTVPVSRMYEMASEGLVRELEDPYTTLLEADEAQRLRENTRGRYPGIGIEVDIRDDFVIIIAPISGSPADSAGLRPGDRILRIDSASTVGMTLDEVLRALRGPPGSTVSLTVERGDQELSPFTIQRRQITYHPVQRAMLAVGGVGYVELATFSEAAAAEVRRAVDSLRGAGASSLVLDLRGNPGGLLEEGIAVADLFLDAGAVIASTRGRTPEANQEFADGTAARWAGIPMIVLVDSGTASAAEIVAGALQDNDRAVILGSPTYGKGSAQNVFPVAGNHALKLTTARWFTPDGRSIERDSAGTGGITPDVVVRAGEATGDLGAGMDPVMARALRLLDGVTSPGQLRARVRD